MVASAAATRAGAPATTGNRGANPWLIAVLVARASFMEVLDTTIVNLAIPDIAGGLGVGADEASWVVTSYLVANAVSLTASSFFTRRLGRKAFFLICLALFTASSVLCTYASNLDALLLFRIVQGFAGGGMVPVAQSILADAFPPEKRGQGFALFSVAVVVAPVVGPTLGGWLADNLTWRWSFIQWPGRRARLRADPARAGGRDCGAPEAATTGRRLRSRRLRARRNLSRRTRDRARPRAQGPSDG
jgi:DHA2 family multidrug resistance protein